MYAHITDKKDLKKLTISTLIAQLDNLCNLIELSGGNAPELLKWKVREMEKYQAEAAQREKKNLDKHITSQ